MSNPASTVDGAPLASTTDDPPPRDGWRENRHAPNASLDGTPDRTLAALRSELDRIDDALQDLLIERAKIVEQVARTGKPAAFRPGREASIVRRLVARHRGSLPPASLFRIWRELLAGTTGMQGGFSMTVCDADPGAMLTQLAREHFGALTPLRQCATAAQALDDLDTSTASVAVLPFPSETDTWWVAMLRRQPRLHIIGRLPFWGNRPPGTPSIQAVVVATAPPDASADDRSFVGFACGSDISRVHLSEELAAAGLAFDMLLLAHEPGSTTILALAEVNGFLADDDPRLGKLGTHIRAPAVVGSYAVPFGEPR
jgi:chorismate mutase / prephenate dehydratase